MEYKMYSWILPYKMSLKPLIYFSILCKKFYIAVEEWWNHTEKSQHLQNKEACASHAQFQEWIPPQTKINMTCAINIHNQPEVLYSPYR